MFITVDVIASRFGTLLAGMHIIAVALIGAYAMQGAIERRALRLLRFALTFPVFESAARLIVEDHRRRSFQTWDGIRALAAIRIAPPDNRASTSFLRQALPEAEPAFFADNDELDALLAESPPSFDAVLKLAEEGAAWTIRYPRLNLATPLPILRVPVGYAVARGDHDLLTFFNARDECRVDKRSAVHQPLWWISRCSSTLPMFTLFLSRSLTGDRGGRYRRRWERLQRSRRAWVNRGVATSGDHAPGAFAASEERPAEASSSRSSVTLRSPGCPG